MTKCRLPCLGSTWARTAVAWPGLMARRSGAAAQDDAGEFAVVRQQAAGLHRGDGSVLWRALSGPEVAGNRQADVAGVCAALREKSQKTDDRDAEAIAEAATDRRCAL